MDNEPGGLTPLIGKVGWGAFLLALGLAPLIGGAPSGTTYGEDVSLNALRALVILAALCLTLTAEPTAPRKIAPATAAVWALFALTLVSLLAHSAFLTSPVLLFAQIPATLDWLCFALVFTLGAEMVRRDRGNLAWIVGAIGAGAGLSALSGAWNYVVSGAGGDRVSGTFFDPNFLAGFLALGLPLLVAGMFAARKTAVPIGLGLTAGVAIAALAATGSRAGVAIGIGGTVVTVVAAALSHTTLCKRRVALLVLGGLAFAWAFRGPLTARVTGGATASAGQEHSGQFRKETWRGTVAMAKANPALGTGPGTFPYRYPPYAIVEKSGLAHSSYLQIAGEQGFPALAAALAALGLTVAALAATLLRARSRRASESPLLRTETILLCGVGGALLAGIARSVFDSEWSIFGNALPFWAVAGLAASSPWLAKGDHSDDKPDAKPMGAAKAVFAALLLPPLGLALLLLHNAQAVDAAKAQIEQHQPPDAATVWPPDPDLLAWTGHPDAAATVEPSGARFYRLGSSKARDGDPKSAIADFEQATRLDPNALQSWRTLAETQEKSGDHPAALVAWRELVRRYEGPSGRILAIPELPETHPAFAYAALADDALAAHAPPDTARALYEKAAAVVEAYAQTPPTYQKMEAMSASLRGADIADRRAQIRALYERVTKALADASPADSAALNTRRDETLSRLDRFVGVPAETTIH